MSVVVARDPSTADKLVFVWPEPLSWGTELSCGENEVAVVCPDWAVGEQLGPGRHTISPPNPSSRVLVFFVRTTPVVVPFENIMGIFDRAAGKRVSVHYSGSVSVKVGDPIRLCNQILGVPSQDLSSGVLRSAVSSVIKALHVMITKVVAVSPAVSALATPAGVAQLVHLTASGNPMAIAVSGVDFIRFENLSLSIDGGAPVRANIEGGMLTRAATADTVRVDQDTTPRIPAGAHVLVYWNDGLWHAGTVQQYRDGSYEVAINGLSTVTWIRADHVRPA